MKVSITGAAGRMGKRILCLAHEHSEVEVAGALEVPGHPAVGMDAGECAGIGPIGVPIVDDVRNALNACDVLIDFSVRPRRFQPDSSPFTHSSLQNKIRL